MQTGKSGIGRFMLLVAGIGAAVMLQLACRSSGEASRADGASCPCMAAGKPAAAGEGGSSVKPAQANAVIDSASAAPVSPRSETPPPPPSTAPVGPTVSVVAPRDTANIAAPAEQRPESVPDADPPDPYVTVYYFHRTLRCPSCLQIEEWARQAVENAFSNDLAGGIIEWRTLNMELEENKRFVEEYQLKSPALVLARHGNGDSGSWKDLEKVWEHLGDHASFSDYVKGEMEEFLGHK